MNDTRPTLLTTGLGGLLVLASLFFEGPTDELPDGASASQARRYYEGNLGTIELQVFGETMGALGLLLLAVGVSRLVRRAQDGFLADLALVAGALTSLWLWVQAAVDLVPVVAADDDGKLDGVADSTILALDLVARIGETFGDVVTGPRGLFVLAVSIAALSTRMLPVWFGYVGVLVGVAGLVGIAGVAWGGALSVTWFVGLFGFLLWTLVLTAVCLVRFVRTR